MSLPLLAWYDSKDSTTYSMTGTAVTQWNDKSGNSYHVSQSNSLNQPTLSTWNGNLIMNFSSNAFLANTSISLSPPYSLFAVSYSSNVGGYFRIVEGYTDQHFFFGTQNGTNSDFVGNGSGWNDTIINAPTFSSLNWFIKEMTNDGTSLIPYTNGSSQTTKSGSTVPFTGIKISSVLAGVAEVIISKNVSISQRQQIEGYLAWKWGLQTSLPSSHPYVSTPLLYPNEPTGVITYATVSPIPGESGSTNLSMTCLTGICCDGNGNVYTKAYSMVMYKIDFLKNQTNLNPYPSVGNAYYGEGVTSDGANIIYLTNTNSANLISYNVTSNSWAIITPVSPSGMQSGVLCYFNGNLYSCGDLYASTNGGASSLNFKISSYNISTGVISNLFSSTVYRGIGLACDGTYLYATAVVNATTNNSCILKITISNGAVVVLAGSTNGYANGVGSSAQFNFGNGTNSTTGGTVLSNIVYAGNNILYVADSNNNCIRSINTTTGSVSTYAGSTIGFTNGNNTIATFTNPTAIATDTYGNVYLSDQNGTTIRKIISGSSPVPYSGYGQYYQVKLSSPLPLSGYTIGTNTSNGTGATPRCPNGIILVGSMDGNRWVLVDIVNGLVYTTGTYGVYCTRTISCSYIYYRLIITQLQSNNTTSYDITTLSNFSLYVNGASYFTLANSTINVSVITNNTTGVTATLSLSTTGNSNFNVSTCASPASILNSIDNSAIGNIFVNLYPITPSQYYTSSGAATLTSALTYYYTASTPYLQNLALYLDASTYTGGTTWTDSITGVPFNLINGPTYSSNYGGYFAFSQAASQFINSNTGPQPTLYSIEVWYYYTGVATNNKSFIVLSSWKYRYIIQFRCNV